MSKDIDGVDFVTDDKTGGFFVMECHNCGEVFNSKHCNGGNPNSDSGDYEDCYCHHCGEVDPMECDNANLVWNTQQKKINQLNQDLSGMLVALEHLHHNAKASGAEMGLALDVAKDAIAKAKGGAA